MHSCSRNRDEIRPDSPPDPAIRDPIHPICRENLPLLRSIMALPQRNRMVQMLRQVTFRGNIRLQYRAEFSADVLKELHQMLPYPADFYMTETDHSLLAGRTVPMRIWNVQGVRVEQPGETTGNSGSSTTLFALEFPCTILNVPLVRYYSELVGNNIGQYCHALAQKYRIDIHRVRGDRNGINDVHPIHRLVECWCLFYKKPTPVILPIPGRLHRQEYLVWIEEFLRDIYKLLLDASFKPLGTACLDLTFGILEENSSATERFRAKAIVRPVTPFGRHYPNDFALVEITELPNKNMAVSIMASWWWMLNRHTNGRPELVDNMSGIAGPRMDSESDRDEDALEDTLSYSQESGGDDGPRMDSESDCEDAVEDTLTRSQESGEDTFTISQFQPEPELAGIGGPLTSAALAAEVRAGDCGELSTVASPAIDRRATAGAALNKAADDAVSGLSAAAAAIAVAGHGECSRKFSRKP